jgi:hypothetical protein
LFVLPPWTRAPLLGLRQPAVVLAMIGAAAILACASTVMLDQQDRERPGHIRA